MAIDKINSGGLGDNLELPGTEAAKMPVGTTAQRASAAQGDLRFNSTTSLMEYYDGTQWKSIDSPPTISSISPSNIADSDNDVDITITGTNFITGGQTVKAVGTDGSEISAGTVTRTSSTEVVANFDGTSFSDALEDYDIIVTNVSSSLSATLADSLSVNASPAWTVSAGSLGTFYDSQRTGISITTGATDDEGDSLTYSVSVGSLPAGLSLNTSTGAITGDATAVGSDTTSTFTLSVTDGSNTVTRQYSITINAPVITSYTSSSGSFSVPSGITAVDVLVVAGGGSGGGAGDDSTAGGGGGAGGLIYRPAFPVTPGGTVSYQVGSGGPQPDSGLPAYGVKGQNSQFGGLTAIGGGGGKAYGAEDPASGAGGSGGGGTAGSPRWPAGQAQQPSQPGESGSYGFGNPGGSGDPTYNNPATPNSGGGGGAGGAGNPGIVGGGTQTQGGIGKQYDISGSQVYYAGGGNGSGAPESNTVVQGGGGVGYWPDNNPGSAGQANRGGGGGGGLTGLGASGPTHGGAGGSGIVIVKY